MAFNDIERKKIENALNAFLEKHRPPAHMRHQLDLGCRIDGQNVHVFEIRPAFDDPSTKIEVPVAKAAFVRAQDVWKLYWLRGTGKWCLYVPEAETKTIEKVLAIVGKDENGCFFG